MIRLVAVCLLFALACGQTHTAPSGRDELPGVAGLGGSPSSAGGSAGKGGMASEGGGSAVGGLPSAMPSAGSAAGGSEDPATGGEGGAATDPEPTGDFTWALWPMPNTVASGLPHPQSFDSSSPDVVVDEVTGLVWQADSPSVGMAWDDALAHCNALELDGHTDWRLPSRIELVSLLNFGEPEAFGDPTLFRGGGSRFWSASPYFESSTTSWIVFAYGEDANTRSLTTSTVRCVRSPYPGPSLPQHYDILDDVVLDNWTELYWERQPPGDWLTQELQRARCESATLGGFDDWRLPSLKELLTLVDEHTSWPALDALAFPGDLNVTAGWFWSSTTYPPRENFPFDGPGTRFGDGMNMSQGGVTNELLARCVR